MRHYRGSCHCGRVKFSFTCEEITSGRRCNCSICIRRGAITSPEYMLLDSLEGKDALSLYQWGEKECNFWSCRHCGIYTFHAATEEPEKYRVNLGCVDELDVLSLPIELLDGKSFPVS